MARVDAFLHPIATADEASLNDLSGLDLGRALETVSGSLAGADMGHALLVLFDAGVYDRPGQQAALEARADRFSTALVPPLDGDDGVLERAAAAGCRAVCLHPYLQRISGAAVDAAVEVARRAEQLGLYVIVCTAHGSRRVYCEQPLQVAQAVMEAVSCPVVMSHCGGARILDAMLLADAYPHAYFETSFSLPYWAGSSVETDIAFAMRKYGCERWMFGSDAPFVALNRAVDAHLDFFARHGFSAAEIDQVMGGTAASLLGLNRPTA